VGKNLRVVMALIAEKGGVIGGEEKKRIGGKREDSV